jgi:hypothetical protein
MNRILWEQPFQSVSTWSRPYLVKMDCVTAKPYRRRVAGREYDQQKAIHDNVRVMEPHLQFLQDGSRVAGSSLTPKHWDSTGINEIDLSLGGAALISHNEFFSMI